ncbi:sulfite exporter TauE/SafE family protein [Marinilactibacillus sp. Marseille-P9653]|uniref:sulfite exporter TauE/SafE family protein n=1 Tax=Marinilactibacillus sp. Marseille-P9653 TaxID=2866583 RepID=UPI001CE41784|nr:sulfite exporter TauE/SafE family protein [Marinilactibacillus sp. Marseille-P9653]
MEIQLIFLVVGSVFLGSLMRATFGFGDSVISMPLLALLPIPFSSAVALVGLVGFTVALFSLFNSWKQLDIIILKWLAISTIMGIPFGLLLVHFVEKRWINLILGSLLIVYSIYSILSSSKKQIQIGNDHQHLNYTIPFGFASGMLGSAYNMNGIPIVLYSTMKDWSPKQFKENVQAHFLISSILIIFSHYLSGFWTKEVGLYYLASIPAVVIAIVLGNYFYSKIKVDKFRRFVIYVILLLGLFTFIDFLLG